MPNCGIGKASTQRVNETFIEENPPRRQPIRANGNNFIKPTSLSMHST
jgi:hypothetical protein